MPQSMAMREPPSFDGEGKDRRAVCLISPRELLSASAANDGGSCAVQYLQVQDDACAAGTMDGREIHCEAFCTASAQEKRLLLW